MVFFFQKKKRVLFFNLFQKIFCQRLISKVYDFHIGLSQTDSFTGSFFQCFSKVVFSYFFQKFSVFAKCFSTNVFQMLFQMFQIFFFLSCSQGFLSTQSYLSSPSFVFSRFINFLLQDEFPFERFIFLSQGFFFQDFFDWFFHKKSFFPKECFSQGFFF